MNIEMAFNHSELLISQECYAIESDQAGINWVVIPILFQTLIVMIESMTWAR